MVFYNDRINLICHLTRNQYFSPSSWQQVLTNAWNTSVSILKDSFTEVALKAGSCTVFMPGLGGGGSFLPRLTRTYLPSRMTLILSRFQSLSVGNVILEHFSFSSAIRRVISFSATSKVKWSSDSKNFLAYVTLLLSSCKVFRKCFCCSWRYLSFAFFTAFTWSMSIRFCVSRTPLCRLTHSLIRSFAFVAWRSTLCRSSLRFFSKPSIVNSGGKKIPVCPKRPSSIPSVPTYLFLWPWWSRIKHRAHPACAQSSQKNDTTSPKCSGHKQPNLSDSSGLKPWWFPTSWDPFAVTNRVTWLPPSFSVSTTSDMVPRSELLHVTIMS